jgi:hypothetical protein
LGKGNVRLGKVTLHEKATAAIVMSAIAQALMPASFAEYDDTP